MSKISFTPNASGTGTLNIVAPNTNTNQTLTLPDITGTLVSTDVSGNVGIGTATPNTKLSVEGAMNFTAVVTTPAVGASIYAPGASQLAFGTSSTERMRIVANGNVGIGTNSPASKLEIQDTSSIIRSVGTAGYGAFQAVGSGTTNTYMFFMNATNAEQNRISSVDGGILMFSNGNAATERMRIGADGSLILTGSTAQKATGTTWSNPSDQRLKTNIVDYSNGISELMQVRVCKWVYNGKGGTTAGMAGIGVIADEVMNVLPDTVGTYEAKLDDGDEETTAIKEFDATEITWLLVKAVQEQQALIVALEARITALETK